MNVTVLHEYQSQKEMSFLGMQAHFLGLFKTFEVAQVCCTSFTDTVPLRMECFESLL